MKLRIRAPKDFWAGLMFIGFGLFFMAWALTHYQMGSAVRMGPAYFPTVLGGLLAFLGAMVLIES
ncbi:MAG TPA: tripartite tricarboxylate transporter TctB family protein, partial [Burkholderiales bacterium]|nr:tripartite tricarboxylate transporter TctB family protein [Burkholderiales bacterium]